MPTDSPPSDNRSGSGSFGWVLFLVWIAAEWIHLATPCPQRAAPIAALSTVFALYAYGSHRKLIKPGCLTAFIMGGTMPTLLNLIFDPRYPVLSMRRSAVVLPAVQIGQSVTRSLTFTNTGRCWLTGTVDTLPAPFAVVAGGGRFKLRVGESAVLRVKVAPKPESPVGRTTAEWMIRSNDPKHAVVRVPVTVVVLSASEKGNRQR